MHGLGQRRALLFCGAAIATTWASSAVAQTEAASVPAPAAAQEIVVTGSRITRRDYVSDTPIVTVGAAAVAASGSTTLENSLNQLPQVTASAGASANFTARGGQANVDLRGIGQQRTLVLIDGRRVQPSNPDGSVDLNIIPTALIDNVEVITGGASSVYGSDAIAGVVNLKLKKHFTGAEVDAQYGSTDVGDGQTQSVTLTLGSDFAEGRGNGYIALDYANRDSVAFIDRSYLTGQALAATLRSSNLTANASNLPSQAAINSIFAKYGVAAGTVKNTAVLSFNTDGTLFTQTGAINYKGSTATPFKIYNGSVYESSSDAFLAQTPLQRYSLIAHTDYALTNKINVYLDGLYTNYRVTTQGLPAVTGTAPSRLLSIPVTNPFIPADLATLLASRPNPTANFATSQVMGMVGDRGEQDDYNVYQITAGANGKIDFMDIGWNAYATFGRTQYDATEINYESADAVNRLLQAPDGGASLCTGGFNPFGVRALSQSCINYINRRARNETVLEQRIVELDVQGKFLTLPAGDLRFAAGADYRRNSYDFAPDSLIQTGELTNYASVQASSGAEDAYELYGELLVPVVRDLPFAKAINLDLGYRWSDYNTVGGVSTYKADFDWKVLDFLGLRGGYARATRAPSVGELYTASGVGQLALGPAGLIGSGDPCDIKGAYRAASSSIASQVRALCLAQGVPTNIVDSFTNILARTPFATKGNPDLQPESSDTYSVGIVLQSRFSNPLFSRLSASIDYYKIKLDHAIGLVTNTVAASQCFSAATNPTFSNSNYYCSLITRDTGTGQINSIANPELNLGGYSTSGVDFQVDWSIPLDALGLNSKFGRVNLSLLTTYLDSFDIQTLAGGTTLDYAGTIGNTQIDQYADAHPKWKATSSAAWQVGPLQTSVRWRYLDAMANATNIGSGGTAHGVPSVSYFDLDAVWKVNKTLELRGGILNLADKAPPLLYDNVVGNQATDLYTYDLIGRRFYLAVKAKF